MDKPNFDEGVPTIEDTLKEIEALASVKSQEAAAIDAQTAQVQAETAPAPTPAASVPSVPAAAPDPEKAPVAGRLKKMLEREAALIERENKLKEREAAPAKAEAGLTFEQFQRLYKSNRLEALKRLEGETFKAGRLAKQLWTAELGDLAPRDAQQELDTADTRNAVDLLRQELEEAKQQLQDQLQAQQAQLAYEQYVGATRGFVGSVPAEMPLLQKFAANKPDKVVQALVNVAQRHAQSTGGREILTPAQAAQRVEQSLRELSNSIGSPSPAVQPPVTPVKAPTGPPNTIRNKHAAVQPNRIDADEMDDDALRARAHAAIEAAKRQAASRG